MANTQAMCNSFKRELLTATHNFGTAPTRVTNDPDVFKAALYLTSATIDALTTQYTSTGEVSGAGYTAGGIVVTNAVPPVEFGGVAYWTPSANLIYAGVTLVNAFDAVLIYNNSQALKAVSVHTFAPQTIVAGTLTVTMPINNPSTALISVA